jgi:hypothetical protein
MIRAPAVCSLFTVESFMQRFGLTLLILLVASGILAGEAVAVLAGHAAALDRAPSNKTGSVARQADRDSQPQDELEWAVTAAPPDFQPTLFAGTDQELPTLRFGDGDSLDRQPVSLTCLRGAAALRSTLAAAGHSSPSRRQPLRI